MRGRELPWGKLDRNFFSQCVRACPPSPHFHRAAASVQSAPDAARAPAPPMTDMVPIFLARTVEGLAAFEDTLLKRDGFFQRQN